MMEIYLDSLGFDRLALQRLESYIKIYHCDSLTFYTNFAQKWISIWIASYESKIKTYYSV